jgi:hypothetical protein
VIDKEDAKNWVNAIRLAVLVLVFGWPAFVLALLTLAGVLAAWRAVR